MIRQGSLGLLLAALVTVLAPPSARARQDEQPPARTWAWPEEVVELARKLPVQDGGRVKPLLTFASFRLLEIHGRRTLRVERPDGTTERLGPTEWLLDCLFFPHQVRSYPLFRIEDYAATTALGLPHEGKRKRDDWSYDELLPARDRLLEVTRRWSQLEEKDRTRIQNQIVRLGFPFFGFEALLDRWDGLALFPPPVGEEKWLSPSEVAERVAHGDRSLEEQAAALRAIGDLFDARGDPGEFGSRFSAWQQTLVRMATERGEYEKIPLEVRYYELDLFTWSQVLFVLCFLVTSLAWIRPRAGWLSLSTRLLFVAPLAPLVAGIVIRCVLRERPPVSTLYETILFVTAVATLAAWVAEWLTRGHVALWVGSLLGALGMFFAGWYEEVSATDTMPKLQAVLDTNFWLSTHVTTISIGYSACLLAAAIAHVWLFSRIFGLPRGERGDSFRRGTIRTLYGVLAFGLVFSVVGTILGGVWANESWGRFWGWDPKENGALMICLVSLALLHARIGGYVRDFGLALGSVLLGTVVAFSWFHVNLLGVGLHSYGFDSKLHTLVWSFYGVEWTVFALGWIAWFATRRRRTVSDPLPRPAARSAAS